MPSTAAARARISESKRMRASSFSEFVPWWYVFFFFSGFPALLYQIVWQRALFTLYGVNIESVTVVVTAFLLGLGLGSLAGGWVSRYPHLPLLGIFGCVEVLIGCYGAVSLKTFHWAAKFTAGAPPLQTGLIAFALVVIPTVLMGSTLPILVAHTVRISRNIGTSVGALYAANTFGSAVACFCAGLFLMRWLGQLKTVLLAAGLNAIFGSAVLVWQYVVRKPECHDQPSSNSEEVVPPVGANTSSGMTFPFALGTAGVAGFISVGYEIVWYHLFAFTTGGLAKSFAFLLGAYLAGIAAGSLVTNRICSVVTNFKIFVRGLLVFVFAANLIAFFVGPILVNGVTHFSYLWTLVPIGIAAAFLGAVFPLLCHLSMSPDEHAGRRMSLLYLSNIVGSALGSYITGFVLLDVLSLRGVSLVLVALGLALACVLTVKAQLNRLQLKLALLACVVAGITFVTAAPRVYKAMYEKMLMKERYVAGAQFAAVIENKSGVIAVTPVGTVFGGGIYDGKFNTSLVTDTNGIQRAFALSYFCNSPKEVLMIGLSSGSWAQVLANHPQVEKLTIVEINPGYLPLIQQASEVRSLLHNPKVTIHIDDGRRWLIRNTDQKFDAIVMNTSYHWRSNASNILSTEFLQLIRQHLKPGGVHFYNTTESDEALATGLAVFPYGMRLANFVVTSDSPLQLDLRRWVHVLVHYTIDNKPVFNLNEERDKQRLFEVAGMANTMDREVTGFFTLESAEHIRARTQHVRIITDDNMGTEWLQ